MALSDTLDFFACDDLTDLQTMIRRIETLLGTTLLAGNLNISKIERQIYVDGHLHGKGTLAVSLNAMIAAFNSKNMILFADHVLLIKLLGESLETLRINYSPEFAEFRRKYRTVDHITYSGWRFELFVVFEFHRKGIPFQFFYGGNDAKNGDFKITDRIDQFSVESATMQVKDPSKRTHIYKILWKVRDKQVKPYAGQSSVLFLDGSEIQHFEARERRMERKDVEKLLVENLCLENFGAIFVWFVVISDHKERLSINSMYWRFDSPNINQKLKSLIDRHFPMGNCYLPKPGWTPMV